MDSQTPEIDKLFEGKLSKNVVFTPKNIVNDMLNILPNEVWNKDTKFLDPACKGGEFLIKIIDRLKIKLADEFNSEEELEEHILNNQIYGLAMSDFLSALTQTRIYGEMDSTRNIQTLDISKITSKQLYSPSIIKPFYKARLFPL